MASNAEFSVDRLHEIEGGWDARVHTGDSGLLASWPANPKHQKQLELTPVVWADRARTVQVFPMPCQSRGSTRLFAGQKQAT
jgi:hypothetical protein